MRLDKFITSDGRMSRREAAGIIRRGLVTVNGETVRQANFRVDPEADAVAADGRRILWRRNTYIMLNKPAGFVSSTEKGKTVMTLLGDEEGRPGLFPCGRLDADTEGLLLITDDGALGHLLLSPRRHVEKEYYFRCDPPLTAEGLDILRSGPDLGDFTARPAKVEPSEGGRECRIAVTEGKYHQIKRMVHAAGSEVTYLKRTKFGPLELDPALGPGEWRYLTEGEVKALRDAAGVTDETDRTGEKK